MFNFLKKGTREVLQQASKEEANVVNQRINDNAQDMLDNLNNELMKNNQKLAEQIAKNQKIGW